MTALPFIASVRVTASFEPAGEQLPVLFYKEGERLSELSNCIRDGVTLVEVLVRCHHLAHPQYSSILALPCLHIIKAVTAAARESNRLLCICMTIVYLLN